MKINHVFLIVILSFLFSCSGNKNSGMTDQIIEETSADTIKEEVKESIQESETVVSPEKKEEFTYSGEFKFKGKALVIGDTIELLDSNQLITQKVVGSIYGTLVDIVSVSDSLYGTEEEWCNGFYLVEVKGEGFQGLVNGTGIFQLENVEQNHAFPFEGDTLQFIVTTSFGAPLVDDEGLTGCGPRTPVALYKVSDGNVGLIPFVVEKTFNYLEFEDSDSGYDKILSTKETEYYNIEVEIQTLHQEDENKRTHEIGPMKDGGFKAVR